MTIRSGGRPRDRRAPRPPHTIPTHTRPTRSPSSREPIPRPARRRRVGGGGLVGFLKFLVFALVLAAIVLAVALTALRPAVGERP